MWASRWRWWPPTTPTSPGGPPRAIVVDYEVTEPLTDAEAAPTAAPIHPQRQRLS